MPSNVAIGSGRHRTHPATVAFGFGAVGFSLALGLLTPDGFIVEIAFALFGLREIIGWYFRTYELRTDELVVAEGILTRRDRIVPYSRVQQIDIHRGLLAQLLGLAELRIDTAGSSEGQIHLRLLDRPTADAIRALVLQRRAQAHAGGATGFVPPTAGAPAAAPMPSEPTPILTVPMGRLALAGATGTPLLALALLALVFIVGAIPVVIASGTIPLSVLPVVILGSLGVLAALVGLSVLGTVLTYGGLQLAVADEDLRVDYGILQQQHLTIPRRRVQHVSIVDNPLRRALGIVDITLHSAAAAGAQHASHLTVIAFPRAQVASFLAFVMNDPDWHVPELVPRNRAARSRGIIRRTAVLLLPAVVVAVFAFPLGLVVVPIAFGIGYAWGTLAHRRAGHAVTPALTALAAGVVAHRVDLVARRRVQSARTHASPFQRRRGLTSFSLDIAGSRPPGLYDMDGATAAELLRVVPRTR